MSHDEKELNVGYMGPLLLQKKLMKDNEVKELEEMNRQVSTESENILSDEKVTLDKFVEKGQAFVLRLEEKLEKCQSENAKAVELTETMVDPEFVSNGISVNSDTQEKQDPIDKLRNWYPTIEDSMKTVKEKLDACAQKWFNKLQGGMYGDTKPSVMKLEQTSNHLTENIVLYAVVILVCALNTLFFYGPQDVQRCAEEPMECVRKDMLKSLKWVLNLYLEFHNITIQIGAENLKEL